MMKEIRAVLFDLDGTLLDRDRTLKRFLHSQYERFEAALNGAGREQYVTTAATLDGNGYVPKEEVYGAIAEKFALKSETGRQLLEDFRARFHPLALAFPGLHTMLQILHERDFQMGLVTNGSVRSQQPKIDALAIAPYFGVILISEAEKIRKPDPAIFFRALDRLNVRAANAVFVGDNPIADIEGAAAVGMRTIWKRNPFWESPAKATAAIDDLEEIPRIIAG